MISFSFNPGNLPSVLAALGSPVTVQRVVNAMAESYTDAIHDWIDAGRGFTPRKGQLQQATNWHSNGDGSAIVYSNTEYAEFVERGTGIHAGHSAWIIGPRAGRDGLRNNVSGGAGYIISGSREHKGSRPHPFFFADQGARSLRMQQKGLSVLAQVIAHG